MLCLPPPGTLRVKLSAPPKELYLPVGLGLGTSLLTLPADGYFSIGGMLGLGCALGTVFSASGTWLSRDLADPWRRAVASLAPIFLALPLTLLFLRGSLLDSLSGLALGWLGVGLRAGTGATGLLLPATLIAGVGAACYRGIPDGDIAALLLLGAGTVAFSLLTRLWPGWRGLAAFALLLGLEASWLFHKVTPGNGKLLWLALSGVALAALLSRLPKTSPMALLLALGGHILGSHLGGPYGAAVVTLIVVIVTILLFEQIDVPAVALLTLMLLYRLLPLRWPELRLGFGDYQALPGLMVGALLPALTEPARPEGHPSSVKRGLGAVTAGAVLVGTLVLLGAKAALPLGVGLALGLLRERASVAAALLGLFALVQFTGHILPIAEAGRVVRLEVAAGLALLGGLAWFLQRRTSREVQP
jgi:hypothetical protein